ncbi:MAG: mechanosensitive ion channel domain-containing protein [Planctomycetota bacterium]
MSHPSHLVFTIIFVALPCIVGSAQTIDVDSPETTTEMADASVAAPWGDTSLSSVPGVDKAIDEVNSDSSIEEILKTRLIDTLRGLRGHLGDRQSQADRLAAFEKDLSRMTIVKEKAKREAAEELPIPSVSGVGQLVERIIERRTAASNELSAAQQVLQLIEEQILKRKERIEALPVEISETRQLVDELEKASVGDQAEDPDGILRATMVQVQLAAAESARARLNTLIAEQKLYEAQTDLLPLKRTAQEKRVEVAEAVFRAWSFELSQKRQSQIMRQLQTFRAELAELGVAPSEALILRFEDRWIETVRETERTDQRLASERAQSTELIEELRAKSAAIDSTLANTGGLPSSLGLRLQLLQQRLPSTSSIRADIASVGEQIENASQLQTELELIAEGEGSQLGSTTSTDSVGGTLDVVEPVSDSEARLLDQFRQDVAQNQNRLLELQTELETQKVAINSLNELIDRNVVWIKDQPTFSFRDIGLAWKSLREILRPSNLMLISTQLVYGLAKRVELLVILVLSVLAMIFAGQRLRRRISTHAERARDRSTASLRPTLSATLISIALVLPLVLVLYVIGEALRASGLADPLIVAAISAFQLAAVAVMPVELLRQVLRRDGLAVAHFNAHDESLQGIRRWLRLLIDLGLPLVLIYQTAVSLGRSAPEVALSRLALVGGMLWISLFLWRALEPRNGIFAQRILRTPDGWLARLKYVWYLPVVALPIALAIVALMGYTNGARVLMDHLYWTLWLCLVAYYIGGLVHRWLLTQRRRLTWAVHRERLEESQRISTGAVVAGVSVEPSSGMAAAEISAQTTRLVQTILFVVTLIGVFWIWSPVLPAIKYLESIPLWDSVDDQQNIVPITLANLVMAIPVVVLTWASVRNLPGLIEGVLLERLPLDKPARYAITTLGTYALAVIGTLISSQILGVRWDRIQWLVAALGVGLGFGLQEIFANFISGLILLFEQPIRIGDVVTLGDTTGVVARIRMRATTVTNWDRQELIIPNKDLITGRLVNWTLSDSTNRIVIKVGVAYGSDTNVACELLRTICNEHDRIADDPAPLVTFEGFGDSTLDLVVRCYLSTLDERLATIHQLHTEIHQRFNALGLEIAFPQRDLHLRSLPAELLERMGSSPREHDPSGHAPKAA